MEKKEKFSIALKIKSKNGVLQRFIDEMGWTQIDFARKLDINSGLVCDWFNMKSFPKSPRTMNKVTALVGKSPEEIFPDFLRNPEFLSMRKQWTLYKEVDIEFLPFAKVPEIEYMPGQDSFELEEAVEHALKSLPPKEEDIIRRRFGIGGHEEQTLKEVAAYLKVSVERVRQLQHKGFRRLRRILKHSMEGKTES